MKNTLVILLVGIFFVLQLYVFLMPAYAGTCTADCGDGTSVSCTGASCIAKDGEGCKGFDSNGNLRSEGHCIEPE